VRAARDSLSTTIPLVRIIVDIGHISSTDTPALRCGAAVVAFLPQAHAATCDFCAAIPDLPGLGFHLLAGESWWTGQPSCVTRRGLESG
jgi:hypothetical protein